MYPIARWLDIKYTHAHTCMYTKHYGNTITIVQIDKGEFTIVIFKMYSFNYLPDNDKFVTLTKITTYTMTLIQNRVYNCVYVAI